MLSLPHITATFCFVFIFIVINAQSMFHAEFQYFVKYLYTEIHFPISSASLVFALKPEAKLDIALPPCCSPFCKNMTLTKVAYFLNTFIYTIFYD